MRTILDHADEKTKQAVKSGEMTIQEGYRKIQEKRKPEKKAAPALAAYRLELSVSPFLICPPVMPRGL